MERRKRARHGVVDNLLSEGTVENSRSVAERLGLSIYDGTIVASALLSGCGILYTEDLQDGQLIDRELRVRNPFA